MIILEDANLGAAAEAVVHGRWTSGAGQICCAAKRILVQESVYEPFVSKLMDSVSKIRVRDPMSEETDLGPLINPETARRAVAQVQKSIEMGAKRLTGAEIVDTAFYKPTVLVKSRPICP